MSDIPSFLQWGALGLLTLVLVGVGFGLYRLANKFIDVMLGPLMTGLASLVQGVNTLVARLDRMLEMLRTLQDDVYNGRCRYGSPSAGSYQKVREPARRRNTPDSGGE